MTANRTHSPRHQSNSRPRALGWLVALALTLGTWVGPGVGTSLAASDPAAAAESETDLAIAAGIKPGNPLYLLDRLAESARLALTFSSEAKAALLANFSAERLAEMDATTETRVVTRLAADFSRALERAQAAIERARGEGKSVTRAAARLRAVAAKGQKRAANANPKTKEADEAVAEASARADVTARVVSQLPPEQVQALRAQGYGYGKIALSIGLASASGKSVEEVALLIDQKKGLGVVARELGVSLGVVMGSGRKDSSAGEPEGEDGGAKTRAGAGQGVQIGAGRDKGDRGKDAGGSAPLANDGARLEVSGRLEWVEIETPHFELVTDRGRYVLVAANDQVMSQLRAAGNNQVSLAGTVSSGGNIFMRGPVLTVQQVLTTSGGASADTGSGD